MWRWALNVTRSLHKQAVMFAPSLLVSGSVLSHLDDDQDGDCCNYGSCFSSGWYAEEEAVRLHTPFVSMNPS